MKTARLIPANKDHSVMIKETDRGFWHVRQWRRDIDPGDNRKFRDSEMIQIYDTKNFNRIFRPELYYGKRYENIVNKGKSPMDHKAACLIFEAQIVHDPTQPDYIEPVKEVAQPIEQKPIYTVITEDDKGGVNEPPPATHDDLGTAKRKQNVQRKK